MHKAKLKPDRNPSTEESREAGHEAPPLNEELSASDC